MTKLKFLLTLFIIVLLYAIYYWIVPLVVNIEANIPKIQNEITKQTGLDIKIQNPELKMGLLPSVWLNAKKLEVNDKNNEILCLKSPKIKVYLLPLFIGQIHPAYFSSEKLDLKLKLDKNYNLFLGGYKLNVVQTEKININNLKVNLQSYNIEIKDKTRNKNIILSGDFFNLNKYKKDKELALSTNSKLTINDNSSIINADVYFKLPVNQIFSDSFLFNGTVTNLNLKDIEPYIIKLSGKKIKKINGLINLTAKTTSLNNKTKRILTNMSINNIFLATNGAPVNLPEKLILNTDSELHKNTLKLNNLELQGENINLNIQGEIYNISSKKPKPDLKLTIKNTRSEKLISLLPSVDTDKRINLEKLKKYVYYSDLNGTLKITGNNFETPKIKGDIISQNGYLIQPLPNNIPKATIKIKFTGDKSYLDVIVPANKTEKVFVKGSEEVYGKRNADLDITSTKNVDLHIAQIVLNPLHEILLFDLGPVPIMNLHGQGNINLKAKGTRENPHLEGEFNFKNTKASFNKINMLLTDGFGTLYFKGTDTHFITQKAFANGVPIKIDGKCSLFGDLDYEITANNQYLSNLLTTVDTSPMLKNIKSLIPPITKSSGKVNLKFNLKGNVPDITKFKLGDDVITSGTLTLLGNNIYIKDFPVWIKNISGTVNFKGNDADFDLKTSDNSYHLETTGKIKDKTAQIKGKGYLKASPFNFETDIKNIFDKSQKINAKFSAKKLNLKVINTLSKYITQKELKEKLLQVSDINGYVDISGHVKNNVIHSKCNLNNISFNYLPIEMPIQIYSGNIELTNDKLTLYKINTLVDSMPILVDGLITQVFTQPVFNVYINSKPTQSFIEKNINRKALYPLKIKGDILYTARINGTLDSLAAQNEINLEKGSSIYYMGATVGDLNNPLRIYLDTKVSPNKIQVTNFQYDKLISSQNNKEFVSHQLNAQGGITLSDNNIILNNFKVKTQIPTDAKIFNILFKKPLIKQGVFESGILMNGAINAPKITGILIFNGIDIPFLDTTIKDVSLKFNNKNIDIKAKGEVFSNKISITSNMVNKLDPPYIINNIKATIGNLNINKIADNLNELELEEDMKKIDDKSPSNLYIPSVVIKNGNIKADNIHLKNIFAQNFTTDFSLSENMVLSLKTFGFNIAEGQVSGDFNYNFLNSKTNLNISADKVNANVLNEALFDLPDQIIGSLNGAADLTCNGRTHKTCMDTLTGSGGFRVLNGKMPKLGSLEYLLKASNLVKSGITGLTINSIIDLVTPLKTGEFENINGTFSINSGVADSIQIFSKGKDLSLFLTGTYNFSTLVANMQVFGKLSKKISNILGAVGNTSLNTLFNTIPGMNLDDVSNADFIKNLNKIPGFELNDKKYRIFSAEIYGDINGDNFVKSFQWVE